MRSEFTIPPVVDFCSLSGKNEDSCDVLHLNSVGTELVSALKSTGFLYLKNTEVSRGEVVALNRVARDFFDEPTEFKNQFAIDRSAV